MFLENDYARPLFDTINGGPPKAFECKCMLEHGYQCTHPDCTPCKKVTRTERGMKMHLKTVHGVEEQLCLYSTEAQNFFEEKKSAGAPRKLRMFSAENIAATTKRSLTLATEQAHVPHPELPLLTEHEASDKK